MPEAEKSAESILQEAQRRMQRSIETLETEFRGLRAGRAHVGLIERVMVDYYGVPTPIPQMASVTSPDPRLLVIQPWEKSMVNAVVKAIEKADLGVQPTSDGTVVRLSIPPLTAERREELSRRAHKLAEEARVSIRNVRRDTNDALRQWAKEEEVPEDILRRDQERVQKLTDQYIAEIDRLLQKKEEEIRAV